MVHVDNRQTGYFEDGIRSGQTCERAFPASNCRLKSVARIATKRISLFDENDRRLNLGYHFFLYRELDADQMLGPNTSETASFYVVRQPQDGQKIS